MKFAKVLFFICAIGFIAAAERSTAEIAAEYKAETSALKIEMGYKEMFQSTDIIIQNTLATNFKVKLFQMGKENDSVEGTLQMPLMNSAAFSSGLAIFSSNWSAQASKGPMKNLLKYNDQIYFIPWNTVNRATKNLDIERPERSIKLIMNNKNGSFTMIMSFPELTDDMSFSTIINVISNLENWRNQRKSHVQNKFTDVGNNAYLAYSYQVKIKSVQKSDAEKKKAMEDNIATLKKQLAELYAKLATLKKLQITQSQTLQTTETTLTETTTRKTKLITEKLSIEKTITTLQGQKTSQEAITKLKTDLEESKKKLDYWLKGAVYHRIINEQEKAGLVQIQMQNTQFDQKVNDYFFPQ